MELSLYGRVLSRWWLLVVSGTILALAIGIVVEYKSQIVSGSSFQATSTVQVNCTVPCGTYIPGSSIANADSSLLPRVHDPQATQGPSIRSVAANCDSVERPIDPTTEWIDVLATAETPGDAKLCANRAGRYLAAIQNGKVGTQASLAAKTYRPLEQQAKLTWLYFVRTLQLTPASKAVKRAILSAKAGQWQQQYNSYRTTILGFLHPAVMPATLTTAGSATRYTPKALSPVKTVIPAAIIGFVLSFLLAVFLETRTFGQSTRVPGAGKQVNTGGRVPPARNVEAATVVPSPLTPPEFVSPATVDPMMPRAGRSDSILALAEPMRETSELISRLIASSSPSIYVTSPDYGEPKSESAVGLAASLALSGKRVVLVDADPNARLSRFFGLEDSPGLTDYLGNPDGPVQQLVYPANLAATNGSLWVVPHGVRRRDAVASSFGSGETGEPEAWSKALSQLTTPGIMVVVDGAPALENPALAAWAAVTGGVVVALSEERSGADLTNTYETFRSAGARLLGVVANPTGMRIGLEQPSPPSPGLRLDRVGERGRPPNEQDGAGVT